jgi:hypothetical protein
MQLLRWMHLEIVPKRYDTVPSVLDRKGQFRRISDNENSSIGDYPWMEMAECGQCSTKWYICTLCTALRVHIED